MNGGEIMTVGQQINRFEKTLFGMRGELAKALPAHITPERMIRLCLTEFRNTPKILDCTPVSIIACIMEAAALGLEIGAHFDHCYLIPYKTECTLVVGYKGLIEQTLRAEYATAVWARVVRRGDLFVWKEGAFPVLEHEPKSHDATITHAYAVMKLANGETVFHVMTVAEIEEIRDEYSKGAMREDSPWKKRFAEMCKKTVIKALLKTARRSAEMPERLRNALDGDDRPKLQHATKPLASIDGIDVLGAGAGDTAEDAIRGAVEKPQKQKPKGRRSPFSESEKQEAGGSESRPQEPKEAEPSPVVGLLQRLEACTTPASLKEWDADWDESGIKPSGPDADAIYEAFDRAMTRCGVDAKTVRAWSDARKEVK